MILECKFCNKQITKPLSQIKKSKSGFHFCSRSCSTSFNNVGTIRNKQKERKCQECNTLFVRDKKNRTIFCFDCDKKRKQPTTIGDYRNKVSVKNKHPSWIHSHIRALNRSWNKELCLVPCKNCGYSKHTELAHIKPISSFTNESLVSEVNHPSNILPLCRNCHWEFDHGLLKFAPGA